jgi:hypothetical protein
MLILGVDLRRVLSSRDKVFIIGFTIVYHFGGYCMQESHSRLIQNSWADKMDAMSLGHSSNSNNSNFTETSTPSLLSELGTAQRSKPLFTQGLLYVLLQLHSLCIR